MATPDSPRTLLVGLDAACPAVLENLHDRGASLPTLDSILDAGASGPLESSIPPWTPSAWPSLYTGTNPGKHGVFGFLGFAGYDWDVVNATDVRQHALWELLDHQNLSSVVVNVPVTHPPGEFDGALIPGYIAPENPTCHPEGLLDDVRAAIGDYRVYPRHTGAGETSTDEKIREYQRVVRQRGAAFRHLAREYDPDFGFVQFQVTDTVFHECPGAFDAVEAVYEAVDEQVGKIVAAWEVDTVLLASDHGMGSYEGHEFRINEFLRDQGVVETARGGAGMPSWGAVRDDSFVTGDTGDTGDADETDDESSTDGLERAVALAARVGLTSQRISRILERAGLVDAVIAHVPRRLISAGVERVDFPASTAFARERVELGVRINLAGREPEGVVPEHEYERVRDALIDLLSGVQTPNGTPVFEDVAPREEYFHGPRAEHAVDVVTVPREFDEFLSTQLRADVFGPPSEPYNHKRDGLVAAAGAEIDPDADLAGAHLFDVAPTVLATLGVPMGEHMDGSVLPVADGVRTQSYPEPAAGDRAATDERGVEERLGDLGYMESG